MSKELLRFITCGSVDDGKSSLIGRLLFDTQQLLDDQLAAVHADSRRWGTQGEQLDLALLVDGLSAEREQGITIDVAYRFFNTPQRQFIVADTPGHEQYTRNMVTGASTADAAVILIDARKGLLTQTCRHSYLAWLLGIRQIGLAINKMDLVGYSETVFQQIVTAYQHFAQQLGIETFQAIPVSAVRGDHIVRPSTHMDWYHGPTLLAWLETVEVTTTPLQEAPFRLPVQWVNRPHAEFRGFAGNIASGSVRPGDAVRIQPSGHTSHVARIVTADGDLDQAIAGQAITLTLNDEIDITRGALISAATAPAEVADQFQATLVWMHPQPLFPGRPYRLKINTQRVNATVSEIKYRINVNTLEHLAADQLGLNDIGVVNLSLDRPIAFAAYAENRDLGGFILIDRLAHHTLGAGLLHFALRRAHNIHRQALTIDKTARAALKTQRPCVIWFTGLSGSGKSTVANRVEQRLHALGAHTYLLDGDNVRHGLNRDLGFTEADRVENIRRIAEVSKLMVDAGLIVLTAFISPFRAERHMARALLDEGEFIEVFIDTPLDECERRDVKGLYAKARRGDLQNFTGIDSPYEPPEQPELRIDGANTDPETAVELLLAELYRRDTVPDGGH
jgi:bifunctional enzyme CysN/CysC